MHCIVEHLSLRDVLRLGSCQKSLRSVVYSSPERLFRVFALNAKTTRDSSSNIVLADILARSTYGSSTCESYHHDDVSRFSESLPESIRLKMIHVLLRTVSQVEVDYIGRIFVQQGRLEWFKFLSPRLSKKGALSIWYDINNISQKAHEYVKNNHTQKVAQMLKEMDKTLVDTDIATISNEHRRFMDNFKENLYLSVIRSEEQFKAMIDRISIWPDFGTMSIHDVVCRENQAATYRLLLDYGFKLDKFETEILDGHHTSGELLMLSLIHYQQPDSVQLLVARGFPVNKNIRVQSRPALITASAKGNLKIMNILLKFGAGVNLLGSRGESALCAASRNGHLAAVRFLLSRGANIHSGVEQPILCAAEAGHTHIVRALYLRGASLDSTNRLNQTPLMLSVIFGYEDLTRFLIRHHANTSAIDSMGRTPFIHAAMNGHVGQLSLLSKKNSNYVNESDGKGWTSLMYAVENNDDDTIDYLLYHEADTNHQSHQGWSALLAAAYTGNCRTVYKLLLHGADLNYQSKNGITPLIIASRHGFLRVVKLLVSRGADLKIADAEGTTALMYSVLRGNYKIAKYLLQQGAEISVKNNLGYDVFRYAYLSGRPDIQHLLNHQLHHR